MSDSARPHRWQPTSLPRPWDSPGKNTGVGCHFLLQCMKVKSESEVAQSCLTLRTPLTAAYQAPLSVGFARPEYWSGSNQEKCDFVSLNDRGSSQSKTYLLVNIIFCTQILKITLTSFGTGNINIFLKNPHSIMSKHVKSI